jgi:hypothetical protein
VSFAASVVLANNQLSEGPPMKKFIFIVILMSAINLYAEPMKGDELALEKLNADITAAEDRGDRKVLENIYTRPLNYLGILEHRSMPTSHILEERR